MVGERISIGSFMADLPNTRRFERSPCERNIRLIMGSKAMLEGFTTDMSECGIGAMVPFRVPEGEKVIIEVGQAMGPGALVVNGIVRRREGNFHGVELLNLSAIQQSIIRRMCAAA